MPFNQLTHHKEDQDIIDSLLQDGIDRKKGEEQLFKRYAYFIDQAINKYTFSSDEAFNIYADSILAAIGMIHNRSFEGRSSIKTWLYQIFHNKCVDLVRKRATNKNSVYRPLAIPDMLLQMADSAKTVVQEMMDKTDKDRLQQKLKEIGENCRKILMQWADGFSDKEIAASLAYKTADVVKTTRLRCLEKLRQLYKTEIR
jgi:RNA polymerase sigma-70 factor (ECF subfamily)